MMIQVNKNSWVNTKYIVSVSYHLEVPAADERIYKGIKIPEHKAIGAYVSIKTLNEEVTKSYSYGTDPSEILDFINMINEKVNQGF